MLTRHINVTYCKTVQEAIDKGYSYTTEPKWIGITPIWVEEVVVVAGGMVSGGSSVDIIMKDAEGNRYLAVISGNLLKSIPT